MRSPRVTRQMPPIISSAKRRPSRSTDGSRTITATEVKEWFGTSRKARLNDAQYIEIAAGLTKFRWPGDPPLLPQSPWFVEKIQVDDDRWWDFRGNTTAAKLLLQSAPAMIEHWKGLLWAPETSGGYEAIKTLAAALTAALPYIEWPFGEGEPATGRKKPKDWHMSAVFIANLLIRQMMLGGHPKPAITRNSILVRVADKALNRMGFRDYRMVHRTALAAHLTRWNEKYGLTPSGIASLTTKQTPLAL